MEGQEQENKNENPQQQDNQWQNNQPENLNNEERQEQQKENNDIQEQKNKQTENQQPEQTSNEEQTNNPQPKGENMSFLNNLFEQQNNKPNNQQNNIPKQQPQQINLPHFPNRQYQNMAQNYENSRGFNNFQNPQPLQDGQNNFYVNTQPQQQNRQNFDDNNSNNYKFDKTGSNIYDIQRSLMNFKEPDNKVLSTVIGDVNKDIPKDKSLEDIEKNVKKKIKDLKPIKQWYNGYKDNFLNIVGELAKKIDKDGKLDVTDLKEWKEKTIKNLQDDIKKEINNKDVNMKLKTFLVRASIELDGINGTFKEPFDADKLQFELTELTEKVIARKAKLDDDILDKLLTILIDFFTLRRTHKDLKEADDLIENIREDVEELLKAKNFKDHEITFTRIKKRLSSLKTIFKRQGIDFKQYDDVVKTLNTRRIDKVDGIEIITELVKNLGRESVVSFYKDLSVDNQKRIHDKLYKYISKETSLTGNRENEIITTTILTNNKQKDVNKKIDELTLNDRQKKITKKLCDGAISDERKLIENEFEENTKKFEAIQNGILDIYDANENKVLTDRIIKAIGDISTYYKNKIEFAMNNINNVSTTGMPTGTAQSDLLMHYFSSCQSDIMSLLKLYKDKYGYIEDEEKRKEKIEKSKKDFKEKSKRYESIKDTFFSKEKDKETGEEKKVLKTGKEDDLELIEMVLERDNLTELKFSNWENIQKTMEQNIEILKNTIEPSVGKLNNLPQQNEPKTIMDNEFNKNRIINNCYENLMDKKYINTGVGMGRGGFGGGPF